jgi:hypothetical protein
MPVKLKKNQFTAGDMDFHVRRRFKGNAAYAKKVNSAGDYTPKYGDPTYINNYGQRVKINYQDKIKNNYQDRILSVTGL